MFKLFYNLKFLFFFGFFIKALVLYHCDIEIVNIYYSKFILNSFEDISVNPWKSWVDIGGDLKAFPYGYVAWFSFFPVNYFFYKFDLPIVNGYMLTLIIFDLICLYLLLKLFNGNKKFVFILYWLSPIIIFSTYYLGLNDILPITFTMLALYFFQKKFIFFSGLFFVGAVSAKFSMILIIPFFIILMLNNKNYIDRFSIFIFGLMSGFLIFILPILFNTYAFEMLFSNPEISKAVYLTFNFGTNREVLFTPAIYIIFLYLISKFKNLNLEIIFTFSFLIFTAIVLFQNTSFGWFVWIVPFIVLLEKSHDFKGIFLIKTFNILFVILIIFNSTENGEYFKLALDNTNILYQVSYKDINLWAFSVLFIIGSILSLKIFRENIINNKILKFYSKKYVIGIVGDSGVGKDTLASNIEKILGSNKITHLSGDNFHIWDRNKPIWNFLTHLNPFANNLETFFLNLLRLKQGKSVTIDYYDHSIGKINKSYNLKANEFIIASGLHTLYLNSLRSLINLKIFIEMDFELRKFFKLKRDIKKRNHKMVDILKKIEYIKNDGKKFIDTQKKFCDILFRIDPVNSNFKAVHSFKNKSHPKLLLSVITKNSIYELKLAKLLRNVSNLLAETELTEELGVLKLKVFDEIKKDDIKQAYKTICKSSSDFLSLEAEWENGISGLMQLIVMINLDLTLEKNITN